MRTEQFMTPRLKCVASYVKQNSKIADVGTDHAYIPIYLIEQKIAHSAIAMDLRSGPLARAKENIARFSMEKRIRTKLSDGVKNLLPNEADTVIIAGMGGLLIGDILSRAQHLHGLGIHYILQPMTAIYECRVFLYENGYTITDESLVREDEKIYTVLSVCEKDSPKPSETELFCGPRILQKKDPLLPFFLEQKKQEFSRAAEAMRKTDNAEVTKKREHFLHLLNEINRIQARY